MSNSGGRHRGDGGHVDERQVMVGRNSEPIGSDAGTLSPHDVDRPLELQGHRKRLAPHRRRSAVDLSVNLSLNVPVQPRQRAEQVYFIRPGINGQTSDDKSPIGLVLDRPSVRSSAVRRRSSICFINNPHPRQGVENLTVNYGFRNSRTRRPRKAHTRLAVMPSRPRDIDDHAMSVSQHRMRDLAQIHRTFALSIRRACGSVCETSVLFERVWRANFARGSRPGSGSGGLSEPARTVGLLCWIGAPANITAPSRNVRPSARDTSGSGDLRPRPYPVREA